MESRDGNIWRQFMRATASGAGREADDLERILSQHRLSPEIRDPSAERSSADPKPERPRARQRASSYSTGVISILGAVWEAAGFPCAVRL
jgi:hypothetical protein